MAANGFIEKIVIPADERQPLQVFGDLGKMLATAANCDDASALAAVASVGCGACNQRYLQLWSGAA